MSIFSLRGEWDVTKRPVAWDYSIRLRCANCGRGEVKTGTAQWAEEGTDYGPGLVGEWRRMRLPCDGPGGLPDEAVACSRPCAGALCITSIDDLYR